MTLAALVIAPDIILNKVALSAEPSNPVEGDVYLDDGTNTASGNPGFRLYTSGAWTDLGGSSSSSTPNFGSAAIKTIASGVVATGTDRNLVIAAQSGTADDLIEITGLSIGDKVLLRADAGDTITVKHNDVGATIKILIQDDTDFVLDEVHPLELILVATNQLVQVYDEVGAGGAVDAADVTYSPDVLADWAGGSDPGDVDNALDQLAARTTDVESYVAGLVIGSTVQAYDADLDAWSGKTAPTGTVVGTTDSQTLSNKTLTTPTIADFTNATHTHADAANGGTIDASVITYTPSVLTDWDTDADPGDVDNALNQLAERVDDLEGAGGGGATVVSANKVHKFGTNQATTSNTMVDVDATNAAITATLTGGGKCHVIFSFSWNKGTAGNAFYRITDGTNHSNEVECTFASTGPGPITIHHVFDTSAGSTTYKLQFRSSDANTAQILATVAVSMSLMEIA